MTPVRTAATRIVPTDEQLRHAYLARRRPGWPASFEEAMSRPLYAALVRMEAVLRVMAERRVDQRLRRAAESSATHPRFTRRRAPLPPGLDRKRAAAGDRDD